MARGARLPAAPAAIFLTVLTGCGYVGNPLPPALMRPVRVTDLSAAERGSKIVIQFTIPKVTTENLPLRGRQDIELRVGPWGPGPYDEAKWVQTSDRIPGSAIPQDQPLARVEIDAAKYYGKTVDIAVSVRGPSGHTVGWSAFQIVPVVSALPRPEGLVASDAPDAIRLEWHDAAPEFRVFRKLIEDTAWQRVGTSATASYNDATIEYGKTWQYYVQAVEKTGPDTYAESDLSDTITFRPEDKFPPAVPSRLQAIPGARSIELVWDRNTEKDLAGYNLYRDGRKLAENLTAASYSDTTAQPGTKYQYQVSAIDTTGNESAKTAAAEASIP